MIGKNLIATAAHCLVSNGVTNAGLTFSPGSNSSYKPYGTCGESARFIPAAWLANSGESNEDDDYAAVRLNCTVGLTVGCFPIVGWTGVNTGGYSLRIPQYPGTNHIMYYSDDIVRADPAGTYLRYKNDTDTGASGAPAMHNFTTTTHGCGG